MRLGLAALASLLAATLGAAEPDRLPPVAPEADLLSRMEMLEDRDGRLTPEQAAAGPFEPGERFLERSNFSHSTFWLRFTLPAAAPAGPPQPSLSLDLISIFCRDAALFVRTGSGWRREGTDDCATFLRIFPLPPAAPAPQLCLLRLEGVESVPLPPRILCADAAESALAGLLLANGIYFGVAISVFLLNLFLFITLRDRCHLRYAVMIACFALFFLFDSGLAGALGLAAQPGILLWMTLFWMLATTFWGALFARAFLPVARLAPTADRLLGGFLVLCGAALLASPFLSHPLHNAVNGILGGANLLLLLGVAGLCARRGFGPARYCLLAWGALGAGILVRGLAAGGILPTTPWTIGGLQFGAAAEAILLWLALADRIREARREREDAVDALAASEGKFRALVEHTPDLVLRLDESGRILYASPAAAAVWGIAPETLRGRTARDAGVPADFAAAWEALLAEARSAAAPTGRELSWSADGTRRHLDCRLLAARGPGGGSLLGLVRDVTSLKEAQLGMIRAEQLAAVGTLAGGVAHEFNNLHTVVNGFLEMILLGAEPLSETLRTRLETARRAATRATGITRNLLAFSCLNKPQRRLASLSHVIADTAKIIRHQFENEGATVELDLAPQPEFPMDDAQIGQVVMNLMINALHAMIGRPVRQLRLETGRRGDRAFIRVADTGAGIAAEDLPRLFLPFFTTKGEFARPGSPLARIKGTGLGLSVCETIIREHGGAIEVESEPGRGTIFTVWLAVEDPAAAADAPAAPTRPSFGGAGDLLIAEDETEIQELIGAALARDGHRLHFAGNGKEALALMRRGVFDLAIVNLQMPGMDGRTLIREMKSFPRPPTVLILTGQAVDETSPEHLALGVAATLLKPFEAAGLRRCVADLLAARRAEN